MKSYARKQKFNLNIAKLRLPVESAHLKKQVTLRLGTDVIAYFKDLADETGIPDQSLIKLYLQDCVQTKKKLKWAS